MLLGLSLQLTPDVGSLRLSDWLTAVKLSAAAGRVPQRLCVLHIPLSNTPSMLCIYNTDSSLLVELSALVANFCLYDFADQFAVLRIESFLYALAFLLYSPPGTGLFWNPC